MWAMGGDGALCAGALYHSVVPALSRLCTYQATRNNDSERTLFPRSGNGLDRVRWPGAEFDVISGFRGPIRTCHERLPPLTRRVSRGTPQHVATL